MFVYLENKLNSITSLDLTIKQAKIKHNNMFVNMQIFFFLIIIFQT